ncbi:CDT1-like protein a, chloroplastic isoform X2 [Malania oleifera]|uniref:CDT1-like protein a, chloroplastic isoform X2 n=1 Tax=Malania oleifera TaxID=397392 RepID=UPI0025AEB689|nr:CDT1-like protein a, chloroplastic isoform X2 [Malania oleifera]
MDSSESQRSTPFTPLKEKKIIQSGSLQSSSSAGSAILWSSKTPEKPSNPPRRSGRARNRGIALSVKDVKEVAKSLCESSRDRSILPDNISSGQSNSSAPRKQIKSSVCKSKSVDRPMKLPEKYEMLGEFFDSMDSSIRLLRMKGSMSTFTNICRKVECLTDRRFSYGHLAQLKFILPEAIGIKKILMLDEQTKCMKPDLHITLNADAIENEENLKLHSGNLQLRKVFRSRLLDFCKAHPEGDDVPEEMLPEPFNQSKHDAHLSTRVDSKTPGLPGTLSDAQAEQLPGVASHLSQSFCKKFSKIFSSNEAENMHEKLTKSSSRLSVPDCFFNNPYSEEAISSSVPSNVKLSKLATSKKCLATGVSSSPLPQSHLLATPSKEMTSARNEDGSSTQTGDIQGTPAELVSTPAKLMTVTPAMQPPKRSYMSPDDSSTSSPKKLVRRPPRSLKFDTPVKRTKVNDQENSMGGGLSVDSDILDILPENLVQSLREKERKALEEQDPAISQAKRRREMIACLPTLFNMIHFLFQSIKRSVITKEELIHKIIASHCNIADRREVEDQLKLLQELVPDWIYEKLAASGDCLLCINKGSNPELIRTRLTEANGSLRA